MSKQKKYLEKVPDIFFSIFALVLTLSATLFKVLQNINSDGTGEIFVLARGINISHQLIDADAFFVGYVYQFGIKLVFQRNAGLVSAGDDYGFFAHLTFCGKHQ